MTYRLVLDENIEHQVLHTLRNFGHDAVHVDELRKGQSDLEVGSYSREEDRLIVTYDDDFVHELPESEYRAAIYIDDATVSASQVATGVNEMSNLYPQDEVQGVEFLDRWF